MNNTQHPESIFHAARVLSGESRGQFLSQACGSDAALRAHVDELLAADEEAGSFLAAEVDPDATVRNVRLEAESARGTEQAGQIIGRFKLLQQIGEGGFGSVWMAEQREPVMRKVALKIIKLGMDTRQVIARFEQERQALALMDHPNIAKVLDAGATAAGRPYFVMELCAGYPITEYCDRENLPIPERLELFAQVCQAVQHAHQKGLIHRDIKPGNILVATQDGRPHAKVIDFGIAKATASRLTEKTLFTEHRQLIGTPQYMSPEQAEGSLDIDTRTDVYSLGVLLYELLTGVTPFDSKSLRSAAYAEIQRIIREVEPPKPSTRLNQNSGTLAGVAARRHVEPRKLGTIIRGELDWIVMKCLEKDRQHRYESANGLAMEIRRYLAGEAVFAAPPSTAYRLVKFVRRNRGKVAAASLVAAALVLGMVGTTWQASRAAQQRDIAIASREREARQRRAAEAERDKAELIAGFMSATLSGAGPKAARGRDITMLKEMLDSAAERIEKGDLASAPDAELRLRGTIGNTYRELALYPEAARMLEPTVSLARALHPEDHPSKAYALINVAILMEHRGDLSGADALSREALEMLQRIFPGDHADVVVALFNRAQLYRARDELEQAETLYRESLAMHQRLSAGDHQNVVVALNALGSMHRRRRDWAAAEGLDREALAMSQRLFPGDHPFVAMSLDNLANSLRRMNRIDEAEPLLVRSLDMRRRLYKGDHSDLATGINNLADLLLIRGDRAAAEPLLREALAMLERLYQDDHALVLLAKANLAALYWNLGKLDQSIPLFEEALSGQVRTLGRQHPDTLRTIANLGVNYKDAGRITEAVPLLEEAYRPAKRTQKLAHAGSALLDAYVLGARANNPGDRDRALALLPELLADARVSQPAESTALAATLVQGGMVLLDLSAWREAEPLIREALAIREAKASDSWTTFNTRSLLGAALIGQNKYSEAEPLLLSAYAGMKERETTIPPQAAPRVTDALRRIVRLYEAWDQAEPGQGFDTRAADWRERLDAASAATQPAGNGR
ncbi:MAG: serine/threonine protein kinase [Planctomycetia bacterium]|nr:MAG: serine/threonine protein kinase [Planctomycetia bacterium]